MERLFDYIAYRRNAGFFHQVLFSPLYLLSLLYGTAVKVRLALYSSGLLKAGRLGCKVVSVGNITVGGTGKTPTVEFISRNLKESGFRVAILSRGYRRTGKGIGIVSDGNEIFLGPEEAGDEPYLLARRLKNIPVLVGTDRHELGRFALERFPLDVIVLDDGFQHIRLKRDLDVLLVDGEKGFGNGYLLPRGPLREPLSGIKRAGIVLINKASVENDEIAGSIRKIHPVPALFKSSYRVEKLLSLWSGEQKDLGRLSGAKVMALSAIANPSSFLNILSSMGGEIVSEVSFPDHYSYSLKELEEVIEKATVAGADYIVTTEKDAVKLEQLEPKMDIPIYYMEIGLDMHGEEQRFMEAVITGIQG
ncbi:MAG: tetraacyldisaccharide 4'-kinase [Deltaproteobacteria bacterium]|nr:tetraacyldisaccharide 4'-kinase [Deltaproteobacteria bacterium]